MSRNSHYWTEKEERAKQAKIHTKEMEELYSKQIEVAIRDTIIYGTDFIGSNKGNSCDMSIIVENLDSVSAIMKYTGKNKTAVLNFSSYKNPGGMFMNGSKAQEECLCHESFLYNVLSKLVISFYDWNNRHKNKALYLNRGLYSPNIIFNKDEKMVYCDVITCAAPNKSSAQKYLNVSDEENSKVLKSRIKYVLDIAKDNYVDTLILGAYGCGVFGQDSKEVANIFKEYLETTHKCFKTVVFAIPSGNGNLETFKNVFTL